MGNVPAVAHDRSCAIFSSGHDSAGRFRPVPCDCHAGRGEW